MRIRNAVLSMLFAMLCAGVGSAQTTYNQRHSIRERQQNQQRRIDQGVRTGQITPRGAAHAEANQARIASEEHQMRSADGGHLTAQDRHTLARQQNHTSRGIYDRKHNGATDPGVTPR